jgi:signal transduction histidine kinase
MGEEHGDRQQLHPGEGPAVQPCCFGTERPDCDCRRSFAGFADPAGNEMPMTEQASAPQFTEGVSPSATSESVARAQPLVMRILVRPSVYRHPRVWGSVCSVAGLWVFLLGVILCSYRFWWGAALIAVGALELWIAYRLLVAPLPERVRELERSRARVVDDSAARLRRIERDLHDGAQAQMVAVAMKLGLATRKLGAMTDGAGQTDLDRVLELVVAAHRGAKEAIAELRDLARGIHPPVLDQGLGTALTSLAASSEVPVEVVVDIPERPSAAIETIAYFCAAELLANVAKHSRARHVTLEAVHVPGLLRVRVSDDGTGGARVEADGGLAGLAERVRAVDGSLQVSSPPGGPSVIIAELPSHA